MFRVFSKKENKWLKSGFYVSQNGDLYMAKKSLFGRVKMKLCSDTKYVWHRYTGLLDKNNNHIYEGDICEAKSGVFLGVVIYCPEHAAYYMIDDKNSTYYPLGTEYQDLIEVIGNVLENKDLLNSSE